MNEQDQCKVWDLPTRAFHLLLVVSFFTAYFTEDDFLSFHVIAGYVVLGLIVFRVIWGFAGNEYARFSNFVCSPAKSIAYLKDLLGFKSERYLGHNPAGAAMIVLLLLSLLVTTVTGLAVYGADQGAGPLAFIGNSQEDLLEEVHEFFANFTLLLVVLHVGGVILESYYHRENLARAMVLGFKKLKTDSRRKDAE